MGPKPVMRKPLVAVLALALFAGRAIAAPVASDGIEPRVAACAACHGKQGRSAAEGYYPSIAGKPAGYLYEQLRNFRDGRREQPVMERMLATLSDDYLKDIAAYYAAQRGAVNAPPPRASAEVLKRGEQLVRHGDEALGVPACAACHGANLAGAQPAIPGLVGLPADYLNAQLGAWRSATRHALEPDCMRVIAQRLAPEDIAAATAWISTRPAGPKVRPAARPAAPLPLECGAAP